MVKYTDIERIPAQGLTTEEITDHLDVLRSGDIDWRGGRSWSLVYYINDDHLSLLKKVYSTFLCENYINPFAFESLQQLEQDVIRMSVDLLHGKDQAVGTITSGGTESIFLALYTYREYAKANNSRIKSPEIVVPASVHPAFHKAAHYLGLTVRTVKVGDDFQADPEAMERAVTANTILLVGSAPSYPHGIADPIGKLAGIALKYKIPLHVDACVGGFMLPWVEKLGYTVPPWDFRVDGVTSISADLHKFGYAAKGASALLFLNGDYLKHQFFVHTEWSGGIYASATMAGSRTGGPIAAAWAAMKYLGQEGYLEIAERIMTARDELKAEIEKIPELQVIGNPVMNILSYTTRRPKPDLFVIADQLQQKGWMVDRQQFPSSIHLTVMPYNAPKIHEYLSDLREAIQYAKDNPGATSEGEAALYGLMARIPARGMVRKNVREILLKQYQSIASESRSSESETYLNTMPEAPKWMGRLNQLLKGWERLKHWMKRK